MKDEDTLGDDTFVFNGVDGSSGGYLLPPMRARALVELAQGRPPDESDREAADRFAASLVEDYVPHEDVDPKDLAEAGWGVIFAQDESPAVREALEPLLQHRKAVAGSVHPGRYREFWGPSGYRPGERKAGFLARFRAPSSGPVEPDRMPYYLLIVGDPGKIPFEFQTQLDLQHAVGRLHFDTAEEYERYARSVVAAERGEVALPRRIGLFGPRNPDDGATHVSADGLIGGLDRYLRRRARDWSVDVHLGDGATKAALGRILGGPETPAVLFTASHGMGFPRGDPRQLPHQGALLCQDWPGPFESTGPVPQDMYFAGDDLGDDARLAGLIHFVFACYGGGTPQRDEFFHRSGVPRLIAPHAFLANLPRRMLAHPGGGALAIVAHVERAWSCSFYSSRSGPQIAVFESFTRRLLDGHPIGSAMDYFAARYGELSSGLVEKLAAIKYGDATIAEDEVASDWTANNDARNYVILGDPAVRVPVVDDARVRGRAALEVMGGHAAAMRTEAPSVVASDGGGAAPRVDAVPAAAVDGEDDLTSFGVHEGDAIAAIKIKLAAELKALAEVLADRLRAAALGGGAIEVSTYVSPDPGAAVFDAETGRFTGDVKLWASTRIDPGGGSQQILSVPQGEIDGAILAAHQAAVATACEHHRGVIANGTEALVRLLTAIKGL